LIEVTLERFYNSEYEEQGFCLYIVKNGKNEVLYIGITQQTIWERWFG